MRKSTIGILALIVLFGFVSLWLLNRYKLSLVEAVVENAVIQKAPDDFPEEQIRQVFAENHKLAVELRRQDWYLERLLDTSRRLEKVQRLDQQQVRELLSQLGP